MPFTGILYNSDKIGSLADVVTPPYDVISPQMQAAFYERSPFNFCRLDLPKETGEARYELAKDLFLKWLHEGILVRDAKPAIYVHHQSFTLPAGTKVTRRGFFAVRRIEEFSGGKIKPHEKTLAGPKADRLSMMRATGANLSPVFSLYADSGHEIDAALERLTQTTPHFDFVTADGERHQLWKATNAEVFDCVEKRLADEPLFIADGHHRYETALNYRRELIAKHGELPENAAANFVLMYFSNLKDPGLAIFPIHRALKGLKGFSREAFLKRLRADFEIKDVAVDQIDKNLARLGENAHDRHAFWLVTPDPRQSYLIEMERKNWLASQIARSLPESLATLDVTVLHRLVFGKILGLSEESQARQENIVYIKSTHEAIDETLSGRTDLTFILNPTPIESVKAVALAGESMPQKSTYFYPKILSGLVVHSVQNSKIK